MKGPVEFVVSSVGDLEKPMRISAKEEIILSAGPYGSPKLLQLSGIGPSELLKEKGVATILADLPVGADTRARLLVGALGEYQGRPMDWANNSTLLTDEAQRQFETGEGGPYGIALSCTLGKAGLLGYQTSSFAGTVARDRPTFAAICELNSVSTGNISISNVEDAFAQPEVHTNFLEDPRDFLMASDCVESMREVVNSFPPDFGMKEIGPGNLTMQEWLSASSNTNWHFVGGCAVGSVVDGDLKLMGGLTGVRVVDSSVLRRFPLSAGLLSSVYMLAEFMSDQFLEEYADQYAENALEVFPLIFSIVLLTVSFLFSAIVCTMTLLQRKNTEDTPDAPRRGSKSSWVGSGDIIMGSSKEESFPMQHTEDEEDTMALTPLLSWSRVSCSYRGKSASDADVTSLDDSYGQLRPGELTAIMGGSGSGKSTLLDVLSGRKALGRLDGRISVLGNEYCARQAQKRNACSILNSVAAYVPQHEAFFPTQTPEEAVAFAANLKQGKDPRGDAVRMSRVRTVLEEVGLSWKTCQRPIGGELAGGLTIRGMSGGERKRLAVACALALKPRVLFLDEITSGLDSENALSVTRLLKRLCISRSVAAMVVIHQPSGALFREFDRLVLLDKGATVFSDCMLRLEVLYQNVFHAQLPDWYDLPSDIVARAADLSGEARSSLTRDMSKDLVSTIKDMDHDVTKPPGAWWKFRFVVKRNLTNHYVRNLANFACRIVLYGACSLVDGLLFWNVGNIDGGVNLGAEVNAIVGAMTFIILVSYLLPFAMIPVFVHDKKFYLAESALGLYSPWIYCLSQIILETWVIIIAATIETIIIVNMCNLWSPVMEKWESFFTYLAVLITSGLTGSALVLFHSIILPSQDLAFLMGSGVVTVSLALSGGFVPFPSMESFISWLQWVSPCKYTLQGLALSFFRGTVHEDLVNEIYAFDNPPSVSGNIGVLLAFFLVLALGTMFSLARQREVR